VWLPILALAAAKEQSWNFDKDKAGETPKGVTVGVGKWVVVSDDTAPTRSHVLAQQAKSGGSQFNICLIDDAHYKDLELSVRMKPIGGKADQGGGLVWRAKDAKNYYLCRYNPLEDNFRVYKVVEGKRSSEFQDAQDIPKKPGWHTVAVSMKGDHIVCSLDGKKLLDVHDSTFKDAGKIGLWSKADAESHFDDLSVKGE
jgi:hypothetical protein